MPTLTQPPRLRVPRYGLKWVGSEGLRLATLFRFRPGIRIVLAITLAGCSTTTVASSDPFTGLADAYAARDAAAAAANYTSDAKVVYAYDGAPIEQYKGRSEVQASFASFFGGIDSTVPLDLNFRLRNREGRRAWGVYRLRLGPSETSYGTFDVMLGDDGLFASDRSSSATQKDFEELPGPLLVRPDESELDRSYYGLLAGRYRLSDGCTLVITRSIARLFVRNTCDQSWRGLNRVSGLEWTGGTSILSGETKTRFLFAPVSSAPSAIVRVEAEGRASDAVQAMPYTTRSVGFQSTDGTPLAGTLYVPKNLPSKAPATVLVHGSGPQDRDGYASIIAVLADALAAEGRVVLTYDKRGSGTSQGNGNAAGFDVLARDAKAAMGYVRGLDGVAPDKVGLAGSSQAGWVVAKAIADGADPADVFLLGAAGAAFTVREQNLYNTDVRMNCAGIAKPLREMALGQQAAFFDALADRTKAPHLDALTTAATREPLIRDWLFPGSAGLTQRDAWFTVLDPEFNPMPVWRDYAGKTMFVFSEFDHSTDSKAAVERLRGSRVVINVIPRAQHLGLTASSVCDGDLAARTSFHPMLFEHLATFARGDAGQPVRRNYDLPEL